MLSFLSATNRGPPSPDMSLVPVPEERHHLDQGRFVGVLRQTRVPLQQPVDHTAQIPGRRSEFGNRILIPWGSDAYHNPQVEELDKDSQSTIFLEWRRFCGLSYLWSRFLRSWTSLASLFPRLFFGGKSKELNTLWPFDKALWRE